MFSYLAKSGIFWPLGFFSRPKGQKENFAKGLSILLGQTNFDLQSQMSPPRPAFVWPFYDGKVVPSNVKNHFT